MPPPNAHGCPPLPPRPVLGVAVARALEAAGAASRLVTLGLGQNNLGIAAGDALGKALSAQGPRGALRLLRVDYNDIRGQGAERLADGLRVSSSLETLDLNGNRIGVQGARAVAAAIAGGTGEKGAGAGAGAGASSLAPASKLKTLALSYNGLEAAAVAAMLRAGLGRNTSLTELEVCGNDIGREGCAALAGWAEARFGVDPVESEEPMEPEAPSVGGGGSRSWRPAAAAGATASAQVPLRVRIGGDNGVPPSLVTSVGHLVERVNAAVCSAGWRGGAALTIDFS